MTPGRLPPGPLPALAGLPCPHARNALAFLAVSCLFSKQGSPDPCFGTRGRTGRGSKGRHVDCRDAVS